MKPTRTFELTERYLHHYPDGVAFGAKTDGKWIEYTGRQYHEWSCLFAYGLLESGFEKGDKIVTITNNRPEWNFVDMGMAMAGVIHVPVYTSLVSEEYRHIIQHSDARMVILSDRKLYQAIYPVCRQISAVEQVLTFDEVEGAAHWMEIIQRGKTCREATPGRLNQIRASIQANDCASLIYTSGTTGSSKGVMLSHRNLVENFLAAAEVFKLTPNDRYLSILPLCHVGGRMGNYQTQYSGTPIYYCENMGTIASNLREIKATGFDAVPRILEKIFDNVMAKGRSLKGIKKMLFFWAVRLGLRYEPFGQKSWFYYKKLAVADKLIFSKWRAALGGNARLVGCGGASLQPRLERIFWASGLKILNMYGLTETSPIITINRQEKGLCKLGSVGALIDGVELKFAEDGEILCRGHNVMLGYYKEEELTEAAFDEEGWFRTGDVGEWAEGKYLMIKDRKKEIFKLSNGKFIAPQLIENKLKESEFIDQVMVVGEHQKFASALIVPDFDRLKTWKEMPRTGETANNSEIICIPEVQDLFSSEVQRINKQLPEPERIQRIRLVPDSWTPATGELSASLKLRRRVIEAKYRTLLEVIYGKNMAV
jgi:long-chain acyl-CoA synthetase